MNPIYLDSFIGGLNTRDAKHKIGDNQASKLENFVVSEDGSLVKRNGSSKYNSTGISSNPVHSLYRFYYYVSGSLNKKMLCICNSTLYEGNDGAGTWSSIAGITVNDHAAFATWNNICYIFNGTDKKQYNGTTLSNISGSPPAARYVILHKDRLYVAGVDTLPNRLYYCDTNDATTWTGYIDIDSDDGDKITGLAVLMGALVIFKQNSIFVLEGNDSATYRLTRMVNYSGCIVPRTIASHGSWVYYVSNDGVSRFNGNYAQPLSGYIEPEVKAFNRTYINNAVGVIHDNQYWLSYSDTGDTTNQTILAFNLIFSNWTKFTGLNIACFAVWNTADDEWELYGGSSQSDGFVYKLDTGTDDAGTDISCEFNSKDFDLGAPYLFKLIKQMILLAEHSGTSVIFTINGDNGARTTTRTINITGTASVWDTAKWDIDKWATADIGVFHAEPYMFDARSLYLKITESSSVALKITGLGALHDVRPESFKELI